MTIKDQTVTTDRVRYRQALQQIAAAESGPWGVIANEALRGHPCREPRHEPRMEADVSAPERTIAETLNRPDPIMALRQIVNLLGPLPAKPPYNNYDAAAVRQAWYVAKNAVDGWSKEEAS